MYSARRVVRRNPATDLPQVKRKCESPQVATPQVLRRERRCDRTARTGAGAGIRWSRCAHEVARESVLLRSFSRASGAFNNKAQSVIILDWLEWPGLIRREGDGSRWEFSPHRPQKPFFECRSVRKRRSSVDPPAQCGAVLCSGGGKQETAPHPCGYRVEMTSLPREPAPRSANEARGAPRGQTVWITTQGALGAWLRARSLSVARAGLAATGTTVKFSDGIGLVSRREL
jgi:hypothetical protein